LRETLERIEGFKDFRQIGDGWVVETVHIRDGKRLMVPVSETMLASETLPAEFIADSILRAIGAALN
jgi:hypothetical protein